MSNQHQDVDTLLERASAQIRNARPDAGEAQAAAGRVWDRLSSAGAEAAASAAVVEEIRDCEDYQTLIPAYLAGALPEARKLLLEEHSRECVPCRRALKEAREGRPSAPMPSRRRQAAGVDLGAYLKWGLAAAAVFAAVLLAPALLDQLTPAGTSATVASIDSELFRVASTSHLPVAVGDEIREGEVLRSGREGGAVVRLNDGSLVELKARSEVAIDESRRGTTVDLARGSVIVQAAPQRSRRLFVATEDCLVSVTGTIFSVNHGTKGSRVSVIEGEVRVNFSGDEAVLHPGDQLATNNNLNQVPVSDEISWSRDVDRYIGLLGEYAQLREKLRNGVPEKGLRYSSRILDLMPPSTVFYGAFPNLGETITETRRLLQEQLDESPALAEWWQTQGYDQFEPMVDDIVGRIGEFGDYLGEELAVAGQVPAADEFVGPLVVAELVDGPGLRDFVERQLTELGDLGDHDHDHDLQVTFLEDPFAPVVDAEGDDKLYFWLHSELVVASPVLGQIRQVASYLGGEHNPFTDGAFHHSIRELYADGADILIAADLEEIVAVNFDSGAQGAEEIHSLQQSGFGAVQHLMAEQKRVGRNTHHRVALTFSEERTGIASWLAAPAPMGSLDFISPDAQLAAAFVFKDPAKLLDDLARIVPGESIGDAFRIFEERHGINPREDFAETLGGEIAFAVDGPLLPNPAWKLVLEVYDPARFQFTVEQGLADLNVELAKAGKEALEIVRTDAGGRTYYSLPTQLMSVHYTFVEGYLVMAPSRSLVERAIRFRDSGHTLTDSTKFAALLPSDGQNNFSGLIYQDVGGVMQGIAEKLAQGKLSEDQQKQLDAAKGQAASATLGYAYGGPDHIILASASQGDALHSVLLRALGLQNPLGIEQVWKEALQGIM